MKFGSNETFAYIASHIKNGNDAQAYEQLADCIRADTMQILRGEFTKKGARLQLIDMEEIIQDVQLRVFKNIVKFYLESESKTEGQRDSWLKRIIISAKNSYLKQYIFKNLSNESTSLEDLEPSEMGQLSDSLDVQEKMSLHAELFEALNKLWIMNSSPDRIMAYVLNRIFSLESGKNGKPSAVAEALHGKTLSEVFYKVQLELSVFLGYSVSDDALAPLWDKVEPLSDKVFSLTAREITTSSNYISSKMSDARENDSGA